MKLPRFNGCMKRGYSPVQTPAVADGPNRSAATADCKTLPHTHTGNAEAGNILAGMNAASHGQSFDEFQRLAGALQGSIPEVGAVKAGVTKMTGHAWGAAPNYGELDYQRTRSLYGYRLVTEPK